ncbi:MAG: PilW family protein [Granulosicoccus sp.]
MKLRQPQQGLSLVELMIATVIGLILIGGMITVFSGTSRSASVNSALTEMQENARFALDSIVRDTRMAGFQGCVDVNRRTATVLATSAPTNNLSKTAVTGALVNADNTWTPELPTTFTPPTAAGAPVPGTHALTVQFGSPETHRVQPMATQTASVVLMGSTPPADVGLLPGTLALISDCEVADIFEITAASGQTIQHDSSANSSNQLSANYAVADTAGADKTQTRVMRFEANIFYIGDTGRNSASGDPVYSLYRQTLPYSNAPVEMVEGVANMKIRLGFRNRSAVNADNLTYVTPTDSAAQLAAGARVESIEVGLLLQSYDSISDQPDNRSYKLAGQILSPGSSTSDAATTHPGDRRMRLAFNTTISIRNRR